MAFTFKNGKHHRSPSGCHNKVRWFLSQCGWNIETLIDFTDDFVAFELMDREVPTPKLKDKCKTDWLYGWLDAIQISKFILDDKYRSQLPHYVWDKYHWLAQYKPYIPYETWKNMTDEEKTNHNWQTCDCCKKKFLADYEMVEDEVFHKKYCEECGKLLHIGGMI